MYSAVRIPARPPQITRRPRHWPLSRARGGHAYKFRHGLAVQAPQFRQLARQGRLQDRPGTAQAAQGRQFGSLLELVGDLLVNQLELALKKAQMALCSAPQHGIIDLSGTLPFRQQRLCQVTAALLPLRQPQAPRFPRFIGRALHGGGHPRQDMGIERVGLRQLPRGLGEVPGLPRIDAGHRQACRVQRIERRLLVAAGRFQQHAGWLERREPRHQLAETRWRIGELTNRRTAQNSDVQQGLADIDPDECTHRTSPIA